MTIALLYEENQSLIYSRILHFHRAYGYDISELSSIANTIFMDAVKRWDSTKTKFSTFLHSKLTTELCDYMRKYPKAVIDDPPEMARPCPDIQRIEFLDRLNDLSEEARDVAMLLIDAPSEILGMSGELPPRCAAGAIRSFLSSHGWNKSRITAVFNEIRDFMRS